MSGDGRIWLSGAHCMVYTLVEERLKLVVDREVVNNWEMGGKSANMQGAKKVSFYSLPFGQAVASMY